MKQYFGTWGGPKNCLGPALSAIHAAWADKPVIISEYGFELRWEKLLKCPILRAGLPALPVFGSTVSVSAVGSLVQLH
jgi:hypothetical protein